MSEEGLPQPLPTGSSSVLPNGQLPSARPGRPADPALQHPSANHQPRIAGQPVQGAQSGSANVGLQDQNPSQQQQQSQVCSLNQPVQHEGLAERSASAQAAPVTTQALGLEAESAPVLLSSLPAATAPSTAPLVEGVDGPASGVSQEGGPAVFQDHLLQSDIELLQEPIIVTVGDRKVRLSSEADPCSLYSLCRKWVRNRPGDDEELGFAPVVPSVLPPPLPLEPLTRETDANGGQEGRVNSSEDTISGKLTPRDLIRTHVQSFRGVRKRKREEWQQRVKRYKPRLCLIFPPGASAVADKKEVSKGESKR